VSIVLFVTNIVSEWKVRSVAKAMFGAGAGATLGGMPKDENNSSSSGSSPSAGRVGVSPNGAVDPEERAFLDRIHAGYRELHEQLVAEGFDGTEELAALRVRAATWSQ
jgi:hypothetical protein